jgi:hypothetical protein
MDPEVGVHVDQGDLENLFTGFNDDNGRSAADPPMPDTRGRRFISRFGSAHSAGFQVVLCDGSVHLVSFQIDPTVHRLFGNREDGQPVDLSAL